MKPHKRIFKQSKFRESIDNFVEDESDAKQIVDISNLQWEREDQIGDGHWSAFLGSMSGYRLPTIQELYTAYKQGVSGFDDSEIYWSSSVYAGIDGSPETDVWTIDFYTGNIGVANKDENYYYGRLVKEIDLSYQNKIETLLVKHLKQNYNKSPKEIEAIEFFISSVLDDLEYTEFTMAEASKLTMLCKRFLGTI